MARFAVGVSLKSRLRVLQFFVDRLSSRQSSCYWLSLTSGDFLPKRPGVAAYCLLACCAIAACAQTAPPTTTDTEMGFQANQSYHGGDIDSVNLATGNVVIHVPLLTYPQRGNQLDLSFNLYYNGKSYRINLNNNRLEWGAAVSVLALPPGAYVSSNLLGRVNGKLVNGPVENGIQTYYAFESLVTADGGTHALGSLGPSHYNSQNFTFNGNPGTFQALDGTGWFANLPATGNATFTSPSGVQYNGSNGRVEDTNGNYITVPGFVASSSGTITDTLGRSIPTPPTIAPQSGNANISSCPAGRLTPSVAESWTPPGYNGAAMSYLFCYAVVALNGSNGLTGVNVTMLQSITLPNNTTWLFEYADSDGQDYNGEPSNYGSLTKITLPTGGTISYTYTTLAGLNDMGSRWVATRTVNANDNNGPQTWTYSWNTGTSSWANTVTDPLGNATVHTFTEFCGAPPENGCSAYETSTQYYQSSSALLKTVTTGYTPASGGDWSLAGFELPVSTTTTWPNGSVSQLTKAYDGGFSYVDGIGNPLTGVYGKVVSTAEFDYGSGSRGLLLRQTNTSYAWQSNSNYLSGNLLDRVSSVQVVDGGGTQRAYTTYGYDEAGGLTGSGINTQHDSSPPNGSYRGNQTSVHRWLNTSGGYLVDSKVFYDTGTVYTATDPRQNTTTYAYDSTFAGAFATQTQLPNTNSPNLAYHITNDWYDFDTGLLAWHKDQNQQQTSYGYDEMWRVNSITYPSAGGSATYSYDDSPGSLSVEIQHSIDGSRSTNDYFMFDGLGRQSSHSRANDETSNPPWDKTDTCYDARGLKGFVSYPYQTSSYGAAPICSGGIGDYYLYDGLKRVTSVTHSAGGTITTSYTGPATSVTDEGNGINSSQKISQMDGLGRLVDVCEVTGSSLSGISGSPVSCGLAIGGTGFLTTYQYDALGNLLFATQGSFPQRSFSYDSLSRILTASNPETGITCYGTWSGSTCVSAYDADGNLLQRTRPAPNGGSGTVTTTYSYDAINRLLSTQYSDGTTPGATYEYDLSSIWSQTLQYPIGRLSYESAANGQAQSALSYDNMGRVVNRWDCTPQNCGTTEFPLAFSYDYVGDMTSLDNGVGTTLTYTFNRAQRVTSVASDYTQDGNPGTLYSLATYNGFGSPVSATLGNGVTESYAYTARGWLQSLTAESPGIVVQPAKPGSGSVTVNGSEENYQTGTPGTGYVTVAGAEQEIYEGNPCYPHGSCPEYKYDYGTLKISVDGFVASTSFGEGSTFGELAIGLEDQLNASNSPVTATVDAGKITITAKGFGSSTNYPLSVSWTWDSTDFTSSSFTETASGANLTGGTTQTVYDSGSVNATVDGSDSSTKPYSNNSGQNSGSALASALASALNGSLVTATASGNVVNITSVATGADTNYPLSSSSESNDPSHFSPPSFTTTLSGSTLTGGANEETEAGAAYTLSVGYANNGDVINAGDSVNGNWTYTYTDAAHTDQLNRLMSSSCASNSTALCPDQASTQAFTYTYDRFGNRWTQNATPEGPQPQYSFNAGTNRVDQFTYDADGNLINDGTYQYTYDAENRLIAVNSATYMYDAEGRRVNKNLAGASLDYLFDPAGRQIAEVEAGGVWDREEIYVAGRHLATYTGSTTYFHNSDWLGTERVRTNISGNISETCQSLPFGDGQVCNGGDFSPVHFTAKQRDTESNLDDFGARYYSSTQGRWISPDWSARPDAVPYADLRNPQSLDLYAYVWNSPATGVDPSGHEDAEGSSDSGASDAGTGGDQTVAAQPTQQQSGQNTLSSTTTVTLNSRPADIPGGQLLHDLGVNHEWISTPDGTDVGMGTARGVPQSDAPGVQTQVVDHTGQVPTSTQTFTGVDKAALATYTKVGTPTGRWIPGVNDCNTWAHNAINQSTPHDISVVMYGVPIVIAHDVVVYSNGSIRSPGGP